MRKRLSLLIAMASIVISVFALNLGVAWAHPDASVEGINTARDLDHAGINPPGGGLWGNPTTADATQPVGCEEDPEKDCVAVATGTDAMEMQWLHSPVCGTHPEKGTGPGHTP